MAVAASIFVLGGCGGGSSGTGAADESNPTTPGEGTAFEVADGTLTINDPENEYVVNRSLTEYLNSQIEGNGQPACRYNKEGVYPNQYECYVPVTTPEEFGAARETLDEELERQGKATGDLPNGLATMWLRITEDRSEAESMLADVLGPAVKRDADYLRDRVCVGSAEHCAGLLGRYAEEGLERVFLWPLGDEARQLSWSPRR